MKAAAIIVAAGRSSRMGGEIPKQFMRLGGRPLLLWSVETLKAAGLDRIVVVAAAEDAPQVSALVGPQVRLALGGATRTASVRAGLAALADTTVEAVLIHDAARPGVQSADVPALLAALVDADGAAPALPLADALKRVDLDGAVSADLSRENLMRVQTPQAFKRAAIVGAYAALAPDAAQDDDIAVARAAGARIVLVPGAQRLMKATYPEDLNMLERLLGVGSPRVGAGFDAHRFGDGDHVTLCGVRIPHEKGLIGHSDADAGWHALTDAILGALALGDIGDHFPPSDPQWRGAPSEVFLKRAVDLAKAAGARLVHVDVTLICERPKIAPHREAMRARTAEILRLPISAVSIKATTTERMGFTGREEGLAAQATATLIGRD